MEKEDIELTCKDCEQLFIYTKGEQNFMSDLFIKGKLDKDGVEGKIVTPKRCPECRQIHKKKYRS